MKIRRFFGLGLVASLGIASTPHGWGFGEEEFEELPPEVLAWVQNTVHIQVEWIEVDLKDYAKMIYEQEGTFQSNEFRGEVQKLIEADKAELKELVSINTRSGQRAKSESITEYIYPTEFDPGEVMAVTGTSRDEKGAVKGQQFAPVEKLKYPHPGGYPNPTAFEMRPVGVTLEVDPVVGADNETIELNIAPEIVKHVGENVWQEPLIDGEPVATVRQPIFNTMKTTTAITVINGKYCFFDVQQPVDDEGKRIAGKKWLVFVKAWLEPAIPERIREAVEGGEIPR